MPVVNEKSDLYADPLSDEEFPPDPARARGRPIIVAGRVENAADDSEGSKYLLFEAPSDCIPDDRTAFQVENTGYAAIRIGTRSDPEALVAQTKATEDVVTPVARFNRVPLWELLGLAEDPGGTIAIYQHGIADAADAGHMLFDFHYRYR